MAGRKPVNKKAAPRQTVVRIERVGSWGRVEYHHILECGHVEVRKRAAPTSVVSCTGCVLAETHEKELAEPKRELPAEDWDVLASQLAVSEKDAAVLRTRVASKFNVPLDAVDVVMTDDEGELRLNCVVILLSAEEVMLALKNSST